MDPRATAQEEVPVHHGEPRDSRRRRRRWPRVLLTTVFVLVGLALVGALVQVGAERRDAAAHPPPGELVSLPDGRELHLQVTGEEHDGPVVVLDAGAGGSSSSWAWIQPEIAQKYPVVSYDRAGLGWSDPSPNGPEPAAVIADLRAALAARGLDGPYVLVGHSLGGHYVRAFAASHPQEVVGIVLVDPSHENQASVLGEDYLAGIDPMFGALRVATRLGLTRLYHPMAAGMELPEPQRTQALAEQRNMKWVRAAGAELSAVDRVGAQVAGDHLGDVPLRVLIAGHAPNEAGQQQVDAMVALKQEMATTLSTNGEAVLLPDAEHVTIVTDPQHAQKISAAVMEVADAAARDPHSGTAP